MSKEQSPDSLIAYLTGGLILLVAVMFVGYLYLREAPESMSDGVFVAFGPISFQAQDLTVRTSLALQASSEDASWLTENKASVQKLLQKTLENTEPARMTSLDANKFSDLQASLGKAVAASYPKAGEIQVLVTDFLTSQN